MAVAGYGLGNQEEEGIREPPGPWGLVPGIIMLCPAL